MSDRKKFKDTKIGIFLKEKAPHILDKFADFIPDKGLLGIVKNAIDLDPDVKNLSPVDTKELNKLFLDFELEVYRIDQADRANARAREIEYVKAGKKDWMQLATGATALLSFILMVVSVIVFPEKYAENPLFHQLMGVIEGVSMTLFAYYFGSSKGSKDKTKIIMDNQK